MLIQLTHQMILSQYIMDSVSDNSYFDIIELTPTADLADRYLQVHGTITNSLGSKQLFLQCS